MMYTLLCHVSETYFLAAFLLTKVAKTFSLMQKTNIQIENGFRSAERFFLPGENKL